MADEEVKTARYQDTQTGSVVNVDEDTAAKLGPTFEPYSGKSSASKSSSK